MRRCLAALVCLLALGPSIARAADAPTQPAYDDRGNLVDTPLAPTPEPKRLDERRATARLLAHPKVADWLGRYPPRPTTEATFDEDARTWTVKAWSGKAGQIALGTVDDASGHVTEAWTGPQVAWKMARGSDGAFGGKQINNPVVWLVFCGAFLLGLGDLRRPLSLRNLDLLALLSFSLSLWFFNRGDVFWAVPLVYPPFAYLIGRLAWIGIRGRRAPASRPLWPVWVLAAATVFLAGFRVGLNVQDSNVIDVGYAGVIGAHRIANGQAPYGHMPTQGDLKACGPADSEGEIRQRIQTNGRCEASNDRGDTYGPVAYAAYLPGFWSLGWTGKWDDLPAAHFTSIAFDLLCLVGLALVGLRFGGARLAATLAFAWVAYPFTQYASSSNTNDSVLPAFLIFGFLFLTAPWARGAFAAWAGWTKFAALVVAPLWLTYGSRGRPRRSWWTYAGGFVLATAVAFAVLLLEPDPLHAARVFAERTIGWQIGRESPFSLWDWRQYHAAGIPDLHLVQRLLQVALVVAALAAAFVPRVKSPLQLAALTGALIAGFEVVLTHWSWLYLPWFYPFAAIALVAAAPRSRPRREVEPIRDASSEQRALVPAG
ncbi:MAG: hypothetical protein H0V40_00790 [Actinobacteria bacterium]|nr:hypothetical protein [Actinomycetota bacterium]